MNFCIQPYYTILTQSKFCILTWVPTVSVHYPFVGQTSNKITLFHGGGDFIVFFKVSLLVEALDI